MRLLRQFLDFAFPVTGGFILLDSLIVTNDVPQQIFLIIVGFTVLFIGTWRLYMPLLPSDRKYTGLRREVDDFIDLVRQLNQEGIAMRAAPSEDQLRKIEQIQQTMHDAVDRMTSYAGVTDDQAPAAPKTLLAPQIEPQTRIKEHV